MGSDPYAIIFRPGARADLKALRAYDQRRIMGAIEANLSHQPFTESRNRKRLPDVDPGFEHVPPLWELRVGGFRVFYDGTQESRTVYVRAIRHKPPDKTTEEITR